jgi:hypothetical protein
MYCFFMLFYVLFVYKCVLYSCHRVANTISVKYIIPYHVFSAVSKTTIFYQLIPYTFIPTFRKNDSILNIQQKQFAYPEYEDSTLLNVVKFQSDCMTSNPRGRQF